MTSPEKAGVGGSIPSLATTSFNNLAETRNLVFLLREQYAYSGQTACSLPNSFHISRAVLLVLAMCARPSFA